MTPIDSQLLNGGFIDWILLSLFPPHSRIDKHGQNMLEWRRTEGLHLQRTSSCSLSPISTLQRDQPRRWAFVAYQEGLDHIQINGERQRRCSCPESDNTCGFWQYCLNYLIGDWDWKEWAWAWGRGQWPPWKVIFESLGVQLYDHKHWVSGSILLCERLLSWTSLIHMFFP